MIGEANEERDLFTEDSLEAEEMSVFFDCETIGKGRFSDLRIGIESVAGTEGAFDPAPIGIFPSEANDL